MLDRYRIRWEIETLFSAMKTRGFNWEDTHITKSERLSNLLFVLTIAFIWAYRQGDIILKAHPVKEKKHGFRQHSIVRYGIDFVSKALAVMALNITTIIASIRMVFQIKITPLEWRTFYGVL